MARIRLRHCDINLLDGYRAEAAVVAADGYGLQLNAFTSEFGPLPVGTRFTVAGVDTIYTIKTIVLGPATGRVQDIAIAGTDTDLDVDNITGRVPVGTKFTIDGITTEFTVVATTEDGNGDTINIEFTPALDGENLPANEAAITFEQLPAMVEVDKELSSAIEAAAAVNIQGRCVRIKIGDGSISYDETVNYEYEMDRGEIDAVALGDDEPVSVTLSMVYEYVAGITGSNAPTPEDILKHRGEAADWITTGADPCEVFAVDLEIDYKPPCNIDHEITTFREFRWDSVSHNMQDASLEVRGRSKEVEPTVIRRSY